MTKPTVYVGRIDWYDYDQKQFVVCRSGWVPIRPGDLGDKPRHAGRPPSPPRRPARKSKGGKPQ